MNVKAIYCPYCGGNIKFDVDLGKKECFCLHCGQQIILDDDVIRTEHKRIIVNEAEIKKIEAEKEIKLKELELKELVYEQVNKENVPNNDVVESAISIFVIIIIALALIGLGYWLINYVFVAIIEGVTAFFQRIGDSIHDFFFDLGIPKLVVFIIIAIIVITTIAIWIFGDLMTEETVGLTIISTLLIAGLLLAIHIFSTFGIIIGIVYTVVGMLVIGFVSYFIYKLVLD